MKPPVIDALVPAKGFRSAKERLAGLLSAGERERLARAMMTDVLAALMAAPEIERVWVISADAAALDLARTAGAQPLREPRDSRGLNGALEAGREHILTCRRHLGALLVVPTDLPCATADGIGEFLRDPGEGPLVRLCPSPDGGTNALLMRPPNAITFRFGPGSARLHAAAANGHTRFERRPVAALRTDVDRPKDLTACMKAGCGPATRDLLIALDAASRIRAKP